MNTIKKISSKAICGKIEKPTKKTALYNIAGIARAVRQGESNFGIYNEFKGDFMATCIATGEAVRATRAFLPEVGEDMLINALGDESANAVEFAFEVGVNPNEKSSVGYEYYVKSLLKPAENDPLAALAEKAGMKALAAPVEAPAEPKKGKK